MSEQHVRWDAEDVVSGKPGETADGLVERVGDALSAAYDKGVESTEEDAELNVQEAWEQGDSTGRHNGCDEERGRVLEIIDHILALYADPIAVSHLEEDNKASAATVLELEALKAAIATGEGVSDIDFTELAQAPR